VPLSGINKKGECIEAFPSYNISMFIQGLFDIYRAILLRHCMCVCRTTMVEWGTQGVHNIDIYLYLKEEHRG
jgi:hypothetical protein